MAKETNLAVLDTKMVNDILTGKKIPSGLRGSAALCLEQSDPVDTAGKPLTGVMGIVLAALMQIDTLISVPESHRPSHACTRSLRAILGELIGEPIAEDQVLALVPDEDEGDDALKERLVLVARFRLLPKGKPITPERARTIALIRSYTLSAMR